MILISSGKIPRLTFLRGKLELPQNYERLKLSFYISSATISVQQISSNALLDSAPGILKEDFFQAQFCGINPLGELYFILYRKEDAASSIDEVRRRKRNERKRKKLYNHFNPTRWRNKYHRFPSSCLHTWKSLSLFLPLHSSCGRRQRGRVGEEKHTFGTIIEFDDNICPQPFYIIYFVHINRRA